MYLNMTTYDIYQIKTFYLNISNFSYIVVDKATKSALVIDPAWDFKIIEDKLFQEGAYLEKIFLTHSHYDHVNLVAPLVDRFNCNVYMSKYEIEYYNFKCKNLISLIDYQTVNIGNTSVLCLHTPGHTAGGMCYLLENCIFTGDTIFIEGCGICSLPGGCPKKMYHSIKKIVQLVRTDIRVYPGHSFGMAPGQTIQYLTKENIYFQIDKIEHFINFRMRKNQKRILDFH